MSETKAPAAKPVGSGRGLAAPLLVLALLAGCVSATPAHKTMAMRVLGGAIAVVPPAGYCVDPKASHETGTAAVVLMGRCDGARAAAPAVISVAIGAPGSSAVLKAGAKALSDYFVSPHGRAALARDGRAQSLRVSQTSLSDGALVLRIEERGQGAYWRAIFGLKTRLITVSVNNPPGQQLEAAAGRGLLDMSLIALRDANPD